MVSFTKSQRNTSARCVFSPKMRRSKLTWLNLHNELRRIFPDIKCARCVDAFLCRKNIFLIKTSPYSLSFSSAALLSLSPSPSPNPLPSHRLSQQLPLHPRPPLLLMPSINLSSPHSTLATSRRLSLLQTTSLPLRKTPLRVVTLASFSPLLPRMVTFTTCTRT